MPDWAEPFAPRGRKSKEPGPRAAPRANEAAAAAVLRNEVWSGTFGYDEMRRAPRLLRPVMRGRDPFHPCPVEDHHAVALPDKIQLSEIPTLPLGVLQTAIDHVSRENPVHPVRDPLRQLQWDGTPRLGSMFKTYFGASQGTY